jgi:hypothetical protein
MGSGAMQTSQFFGEHTVSIFRAEVVILGRGGIYIGLDERLAEGVGQLGTRS